MKATVPSRFVTSILLLGILSGCAAGRASKPVNLPPLPHIVQSVALAPSGGVFADAIGIQLFGLGFTVIDTSEFSSLMVRDNLNELEVLQPQNLGKLQKQDIDAVLSARSVARSDGRLESASVRVTSTHTGQIIAGTTFQGGWGGARGSILDSVMASSLDDAAQKVAAVLADALRRPVAP